MHHHNKEKFEEICVLIKNVDTNDDAIMQTLKLRTIGEKFRSAIKDEKLLSEIFDMFNARSLDDEEFILSLASVITSRQLESFTVNGKNLRHAMLSILQKNFQNGDNFKRENMSRFYNSIRLLGEYFNKARLSNGVPINIIGQSLLNLLNVELEKELRNICHLKHDEFAKLVLSQVALNGNLLKTRHKTEIEQVLFTIRKCLIELEALSSKTKAFLIMTLDLYYSNFTNVGDALEKMYQSFLVGDIKVTPKAENGRSIKTSPPKSQENGKVQVPNDRLAVVKKAEVSRRSSSAPRNLRVQIRKSEPFRNGPASPQKSYQRSPSESSRNGPASPQKTYQRSPSESTRYTATAPQKNYQRSPSESSRYAPASPQKTYQRSPSESSRYTPTSPQKNYRRSPSESSRYGPASPQKNPPRSPQKSSPPQRFAPESSPKKTSPQELRSKKCSPDSNRPESPPIPDDAIERPKSQSTNAPDLPPTASESPPQNGTDENILRQQNSRSSTPSSTKHKPANSKVYFREENVENLTWNGETSFDGDVEDPDASTSPKVNPYSSSFLNFLSSN